MNGFPKQRRPLLFRLVGQLAGVILGVGGIGLIVWASPYFIIGSILIGLGLWLYATSEDS